MPSPERSNIEPVRIGRRKGIWLLSFGRYNVYRNHANGAREDLGLNIIAWNHNGAIKRALETERKRLNNC